jgi:hypothetical protein
VHEFHVVYEAWEGTTVHAPDRAALYEGYAGEEEPDPASDP